MKPSAYINKIVMALMLAVLLLIALVGSRLGLFTDLDEEPHIREDADKIVVVKDGRIEASGKHEELRKGCPLYEAMWQAHIGAKDGDVA